MTTFQTNLSKLGFNSYEEYLSGEHWTNFRWNCERTEELELRCLCGVRDNLHLHHKTYKNLGCEEYDDVIWLCKECHFTLHDLLKARNGKLWNGIKILKRSPWFKQRRKKFSTDAPKKNNPKRKIRMNLERFSSHELEVILSNLPLDGSEVLRRIRTKISQKLGL